MKFSSSLVAALLGALSMASPMHEGEPGNRVTTPVVDDGIILNYALTLEYLERKFYQEALAKFSRHDFKKAGYADPFYANLKEIYLDEQIHVDFIAGALTAAGITPTNELKYKFGFETVQQFITLSAVLEGVGVSAYVGVVKRKQMHGADRCLQIPRSRRLDRRSRLLNRCWCHSHGRGPPQRIYSFEACTVPVPQPFRHSFGFCEHSFCRSIGRGLTVW